MDERARQGLVGRVPVGEELVVVREPVVAVDVLIPGQPRDVRFLIAGEAVAAQQALPDIGHIGLDLALGLRPVGLTEPHREPVVMR